MKTEMKYNIQKIIGCSEVFSKIDIHRDTGLPQKKINKKSQINNLTSYLKHQETEEQMQCKTNQEKVDNKH